VTTGVPSKRAEGDFFVITLRSALPIVTSNQLVIDGWSQPSEVLSDGRDTLLPRVLIDGSNVCDDRGVERAVSGCSNETAASGPTDGLLLSGADVATLGLIVFNFSGVGLRVRGSDASVDGTHLMFNVGHGLVIESTAVNATIGNTAYNLPAVVLGGNVGRGAVIEGPNVTVRGNVLCGVGRNGQSRIGNVAGGLHFTEAEGAVLGSLDPSFAPIVVAGNNIDSHEQFDHYDPFVRSPAFEWSSSAGVVFEVAAPAGVLAADAARRGGQDRGGAPGSRPRWRVLGNLFIGVERDGVTCQQNRGISDGLAIAAPAGLENIAEIGSTRSDGATGKVVIGCQLEGNAIYATGPVRIIGNVNIGVGLDGKTAVPNLRGVNLGTCSCFRSARDSSIGNLEPGGAGLVLISNTIQGAGLYVYSGLSSILGACCDVYR